MKLHVWLEAQFAERKTGPNSGIGKAIKLLLSHWRPLTPFLRIAGAALDKDRRKSFKAGRFAQKERFVLSDAAWGASGRPVHESDSHLPSVICLSI